MNRRQQKKVKMDYWKCFKQVWMPYDNADSSDDMKDAMNEQYDLTNHENMKHGQMVPAFRGPIMTASYMYKYALHNTLSLKKVASDVLAESLDFDNADEINICSLGGAAGIDNVAIMGALKENGYHASNIQVFNMCVDLYGSWENPFYTVMENAREHLKLRADDEEDDEFLQQDLLKRQWCSDVEEVVENADVISMSRFLCYVYRREGYLDMLRKIFEFAKEGCLILAVDYIQDNRLLPPRFRKELVRDYDFQFQDEYTHHFETPMPNVSDYTMEQFGHHPFKKSMDTVMAWVK